MSEKLESQEKNFQKWTNEMDFLYMPHIFTMAPAASLGEENLQREGKGWTILYVCVFQQAVQSCGNRKRENIFSCLLLA